MCNKCVKDWDYKFPYNSDHQYFEEVIEQGYYCNAWYPNCKPKERKDIDELFSELSEIGYTKKLREKIQEQTL